MKNTIQSVLTLISMNSEQKRKLESFLDLTEGAPPPVFVGRNEVLDDIAKAARQVWKGTGTGQHGAGKTTRMIQGAPGAGKSSILEEMKKNPERLHTESVGKPPLVVALESGDIRGPVDILKPLAEKINPSKARELMARMSKNTGSEAGFGFGPFRFGHKKETGIEGTEPDANWDTFGTWAEQHGGFDRPIVLAIDEAQRLDHDRKHPLSKLFQSLHGSCGLPIALVFAGLSDTEYSVNQMDLTRIPPNQKHNIGCFPESEAQEFMARSCAHFGIDLVGFEHEVERLIEPCDGWPRHLHIVMQALGKEALRSEGDLSKVEWERIRAEIQTLTDGYYNNQYSREMREAKSLTTKVMAELDCNQSRAQIKYLMKELHKTDPQTYCFPPGMDADSFFVHLVHQGALHKISANRFMCPIPSFRAYMLDLVELAENSTRLADTAIRNESSSLD